MSIPPRSVFDIYMPFIRLGKYIGLFPYDFQFPHPSPGRLAGRKRSGSPVARIISAPIRFLMPGAFFLYFTFLGLVTVYHIFGLRVVNDTLKAATLSISGINSVAIFALFRMNASQVEHIFHELHQMEQFVIRDSAVHARSSWIRNYILARLNAERSFFWISMTMELIVVILGSILATIDDLNSGADQQENSCIEKELMTIGAVGKATYVLYGLIIRLYGQLFLLYLTRTVTFNLDMLCIMSKAGWQVANCSSVSRVSITGSLPTFGQHIQFPFKNAVDKFLKMRDTVRSFNGINCWALLSYKGLALTCCTLMLYYPSRKVGNELEMSPLTCYVCVTGILQRVFVQLYSMGQVYSRSNNFGMSWKAEFAGRSELTSKNLAILKVCSAFGFEVGHFYIIVPSTILMFCSVLLSYVILVYQI